MRVWARDAVLTERIDTFAAPLLKDEKNTLHQILTINQDSCTE
jgi:hypothetical protein